MIDLPFSPPKYYQVKQALLEEIQSGKLKSGDSIPSERELISSLSVSRITVRKAIEELEQEGWLYKMQGKGTFVKGEKKEQNLFSLTSCTEDVIRQGMTPTRKVVNCSVEAANADKQTKLHLGNGEKLFSLCRVYYADGKPINYTKAYLTYKLFPNIETHDFEKESLYKVLENEYGLTIKRASRTIEAVIASPEIADLLQIKAGTPLILFSCITCGEVLGRETPFETFECYYRTDIFKFSIDQVRE